MEFTSITFLILATDEKESLIETADTLSGICPGGELKKILLLIPRKITPEFDATVGFLGNKYPVRLGVPVYEFPAVCRGRKEGKSKNSFAQTAAYLKTAFRVRFTPRKKLLINASPER